MDGGGGGEFMRTSRLDKGCLDKVKIVAIGETSPLVSVPRNLGSWKEASCQ